MKPHGLPQVDAAGTTHIHKDNHMKRLASALSAALAFSFVAGSYAPAMAAPVMTAPMVSSDSDTTLIQQRRDRRDMRRNHFERRGNSAYYNGKRGYRERRSGYRQYNGYWFPPAAFALGAIIGGSVNRGTNLSTNHLRWCEDRYRSYRASDNSYQPNYGPRRVCASPYS